MQNENDTLINIFLISSILLPPLSSLCSILSIDRAQGMGILALMVYLNPGHAWAEKGALKG